MYPKEMHAYVHQKTSTGMFILPLYVIARNTQTSINDRIYNKPQHIHKMEYCTMCCPIQQPLDRCKYKCQFKRSSEVKIQFLSHTGHISQAHLSKVNKTQRSIYCMPPFTQSSKINKTNPCYQKAGCMKMNICMYIYD